MALRLTDFEDDLQLAAAEQTGIPHLVTRNLSDDTSTEKLTVVSVRDLLDLLDGL